MGLGRTSLLGIEGIIRAVVTNPDGSVDQDVECHNMLCSAGLGQLAAAINWSGIEDVSAAIGTGFNATYLAPTYGAVGASVGTTVTLSVPLSAANTYTTITVSTPVTLTAGTVLTLNVSGSGASQSVVLATNATAATLLNVTSFLANANYSAGTTIGWVTAADTTLNSELARATVSQATYSGGTGTASWTWTFLYGTTASNWTVTEAGIFVAASATSGSGLLLDHVLIMPNVTKLTSQALTLQATFSISTV